MMKMSVELSELLTMWMSATKSTALKNSLMLEVPMTAGADCTQLDGWSSRDDL